MLVGHVRPGVEVAVHPLAAHVDRVVLAGHAQTVSVHRSERAVGRNRPGNRLQVFQLARLGVELRDPATRDRKHLLLARDQEPRRDGGSFADNDRNLIFVGDDLAAFVCQVSDRSGDGPVFDGPDNRIDQDHQQLAGPSSGARYVDRSHVRNHRTQHGVRELGQSWPASAPQSPVDRIFRADIHSPRRRPRTLITGNLPQRLTPDDSPHRP